MDSLIYLEGRSLVIYWGDKMIIKFELKETPHETREADDLSKGETNNIYVGGLGDARIDETYGFITVHYVLEEDGTKSWQLLPDEHSDKGIKTAKVFPLDTDTINQALKEPQSFGLNVERKKDREIYDKLGKMIK